MPDSKSINFTLCKLDSCSFQWALKSTLVLLSLLYSNNFGQNMRFLNETGCFPLPTVKSSHSAIRPNQGNHRYGSQHSQSSLPVHLSSWKGAVCPRYVLYTALKLQGKLVFAAWILGSDGKSRFFSLVKARELQPQTNQKNTLDHLSLHYSKKFGQVFEFPKRNRPLSPTCLEVIRQFSSFQSLSSVQLFAIP